MLRGRQQRWLVLCNRFAKRRSTHVSFVFPTNSKEISESNLYLQLLLAMKHTNSSFAFHRAFSSLSASRLYIFFSRSDPFLLLTSTVIHKAIVFTTKVTTKKTSVVLKWSGIFTNLLPPIISAFWHNWERLFLSVRGVAVPCSKWGSRRTALQKSALSRDG